MPAPPSIPLLARQTLALARARAITLTTAESCTGGLVAAALTSIAGASDVFEQGFVTYSNAAKSALLGVPAPLFAQFGAVSHPVAAAMAEGALRAAKAGAAVSITGIAGPGGGSLEKPVGLVFFAAATAQGGLARLERRFDPALGRTGIRRAATREALILLATLLKGEGERQFA